jgi:hypothetical protein
VSNVLMGCLGTAYVALFGKGTWMIYGNGTCDDFMGIEHVVISWEMEHVMI